MLTMLSALKVFFTKFVSKSVVNYEQIAGLPYFPCCLSLSSKHA